MIKIKTKQQIETMADGGKILKEILQNLSLAVKPGIKTEELDKLAEELVFSWVKKNPEASILSSFKGYRGYPAFICISVNDEVVHGLPSDRVIKKGDVIGLDFAVKYKGLHVDSALTVGVGEISTEAKKLIRVTKEALDVGIKEATVGNTTGDIGFAIQKYVEKNGFSVVRELVGHGIGEHLHEEPYVPNYGKKKEGETLKEGMTIAIEPMVNFGKHEVVLAKDGITYRTKDGSLSAHFEHTVVITKDGPRILTT
ncbi:MAG: type I methionyl aminopeptidase [Candidatus Yanofskybacteria bacterium]|nr:type I methionyl aminopeptidase [Candidatus Yanofskybacteria bacterium]